MVYIFGIDVPLIPLLFGVLAGGLVVLGLLVYSITRAVSVNRRLEQLLSKEREDILLLERALARQGEDIRRIEHEFLKVEKPARIAARELPSEAAVEKLRRELLMGRGGREDMKKALEEKGRVLAHHRLNIQEALISPVEHAVVGVEKSIIKRFKAWIRGTRKKIAVERAALRKEEHALAERAREALHVEEVKRGEGEVSRIERRVAKEVEKIFKVGHEADAGRYKCVRCGKESHHKGGKIGYCPACGSGVWVAAKAPKAAVEKAQ